jgi:hypothetical protein
MSHPLANLKHLISCQSSGVNYIKNRIVFGIIKNAFLRAMTLWNKTTVWNDLVLLVTNDFVMTIKISGFKKVLL